MDERTAIHWEPNLSIKQNQPTQLSFYAADTPTTYEVRVEGVTTKGKPIFKTMTLDVE